MRKLGYFAVVVLIFKVMLSGFFSSGYVENLFIPFVNLFSTKGYSAWGLFEGGFSYPPLMVICIFITTKISSLLDIVYLQNIVFHIPILVADIIIYYYLCKLLPSFKKEVDWYYLLSPIVLYSSYMHSQLDLIPTALLFVSMYHLSKNRFFWSFLILGISIAIKWHNIVILPFTLIYILKKNTKTLDIIKLGVLSVLPILITLLPFGSVDSALRIFGVQEGNLVYESYLQIFDLKVFLFPLFYFLILGFAFTLKKMNKDILLGGAALVFMGFVVVVYPNPGWFLWSLPFICYSFIVGKGRKEIAFLLYLLISLTYCSFFLFFYQHPINGFENLLYLGEPVNFLVQNENLRSLNFTLLISMMCLGMYGAFKSVIASNIVYKRKFQSFLIGIAGDSGAGKTTILDALSKLLGPELLLTLEGDAEHKWERGDENWNTYTHLNPKANELHSQLSHVIKLKKGITTFRSDYNHGTGLFDPRRKLKSKEFIVLAGLHPFYLKGARNHIDFKVYLDTDDSLRKNWKVARDVAKRGYTPEKILNQLKAREADFKKYIEPQKHYADLVIRYLPKVNVDIEGEIVEENQIYVEYEIDIDINIEPFLNKLKECGVSLLSHEYGDDLLKQCFKIELRENVSFDSVGQLFAEFFDFININQVHWLKGLSGMNQVVLVFCLCQKYSIGDYNEY